jgi:hypothetical protein
VRLGCAEVCGCAARSEPLASFDVRDYLFLEEENIWKLSPHFPDFGVVEV